jgi:hypothetical protein
VVAELDSELSTFEDEVVDGLFETLDLFDEGVDLVLIFVIAQFVSDSGQQRARSP